jgi:putative aldouronate transport system substrate-binding protein
MEEENKTSPPATTASTSSTTTNPATTEETSQEYVYTGSSPISQEKIKISVLSCNGASKILGFENMTWYQEILKRANVEMEMEEIDHSSYKDVIRPRLAAGVDLPDLVLLPDHDDDLVYADSGIFIELTEYYEKYGYNFKQQFEANKNLKSEITTPDGEIYYIPYIYVTNVRTLMLNRSFLDNLGIAEDSIKTLDDYYNYLIAVKTSDANGNGDATDEIPMFSRAGKYIRIMSMYWGLELLSNDCGFQIEDDGTVISGFADPRYLDFLTFMNKLYEEGLLYNEFASSNYDIQNAFFANNQTGSICHYLANTTGYSSKIDPDWTYDDDPIMMPLNPPLTGPYGDQYVFGRDVAGTFFGITKFCEDPESVFCFVDYLYGKEAGDLAWFGLEGTDYNIVDGKYVFTDVFLEDKDKYRSNNGWNFSGLPGYQSTGGYFAAQHPAVQEANIELIDGYLLSPSVNFSFKTDEENVVLRSYLSDLETYMDENLYSFIMGSRPLSEWDAYLEQLNDMHLDEVLAVYQASADRANGN